jgi:hypothetical protein
MNFLLISDLLLFKLMSKDVNLKLFDYGMYLTMIKSKDMLVVEYSPLSVTGLPIIFASGLLIAI